MGLARTTSVPESQLPVDPAIILGFAGPPTRRSKPYTVGTIRFVLRLRLIRHASKPQRAAPDGERRSDGPQRLASLGIRRAEGFSDAPDENGKY